jgi:hypothetical protein
VGYRLAITDLVAPDDTEASIVCIREVRLGSNAAPPA